MRNIADKIFDKIESDEQEYRIHSLEAVHALENALQDLIPCQICGIDFYPYTSKDKYCPSCIDSFPHKK